MAGEIKLQQQYWFIAPEIVPEDFWLGSGKLGSVIINEKGNWIPYLPMLEHQRKLIETNSCVSFGTLSALEILYKFFWETEPNYSDRYISKMSGTDPYSGNNPKKVSATIREYGNVAEEKWPFPKELSIEEYFKEIPESIKDAGKEWLSQFEYGYEWVSKEKLKSALQRSPVGVAVSAWQQNENGEYIKFSDWNHWCVLVSYDEYDRPIVWDSYDEGLKTLERDYDFGFPQIYKISKKQPIEQIKNENIFLVIYDLLKKAFKL